MTTARPHHPIAVLYATREGHTRTIAEHVGAALRAKGLSVMVHDVSRPLPLVLGELGLVIALASVHGGRHEPAMVDFVRSHREALSTVPSAFLSVSLDEAAVENEALDLEARVEALAGVHRSLGTFFEETGWHPERVLPVAGCVAYTRYGVLKRFVVRRIVRGAGGPTDTSRDHVLTDWEALDHFVEDTVAHARALGAELAPLPA